MQGGQGSEVRDHLEGGGLEGPATIGVEDQLGVVRQNKLPHFTVQGMQNPHNGIDHNKLRTYTTLKGSFTTEPYLTLVKNRNQRQHLTRLGVSASNLDIERLRYSIVPVTSRTCRFVTISIQIVTRNLLMINGIFSNVKILKTNLIA